VATKRLLKESGLPISLKEVGVEAEAFAEMADKASPVRHVALNPRIPTREDLIALYRRAYQGFE
jgi:alcohol dehydrogenase class IV